MHPDVPYISAYLVANVRLAIAEAVKTSPAFWSSLNFFFATRLERVFRSVHPVLHELVGLTLGSLRSSFLPC